LKRVFHVIDAFRVKTKAALQCSSLNWWRTFEVKNSTLWC